MRILFLRGWQSAPGGLKSIFLNLHSRADEVVPFSDSEKLVRNSGGASESVIIVDGPGRLMSSRWG